MLGAFLWCDTARNPMPNPSWQLQAHRNRVLVLGRQLAGGPNPLDHIAIHDYRGILDVALLREGSNDRCALEKGCALFNWSFLAPPCFCHGVVKQQRRC
jgi:hypothetical protein